MKIYNYVGPPDLWNGTQDAIGVHIDSNDSLEGFLAELDVYEINEPFTYVVDVLGKLRLAPRRSEHVACAAGQPVLAAGEVGFARQEESFRWSAEYISNQSAGYCPDLDSWTAVARALDDADIDHGNRYTDPIIFRKCLRCESWNLVKEEFFVCSLCDSDLPINVPQK
ncbi:hypothetical protein RB201_10750 [Streptomyces sp. S1A(2023)]